MTKQLFDEVIGTPPPSTVDIRGLVRRENRRRFVRRASYGMTAVVALAVSAGVVASVSDAHPGPRSAPIAVQSAQDTRFQLLADDKASAEVTAKRLSQTLDGALKRAAPGATWATIKGSDAANPTADGLPFITLGNLPDSSTGYFSGLATVEADKRMGLLQLMTQPQVDPGTRTPKKPIQLACAGEAGCTESTAPNGEKIVTLVAQKGNVYSQEVRIGIPGKRMLIIELASTNSNETPLTMKQVTAIAVDVASYIKA
jgi:hypothetical protein